jgi:hypothetical protein
VKNSASSRAIPVAKQLKKIVENPARPVIWPVEQKGMQGGPPLSSGAQEAAQAIWDAMTAASVRAAEDLNRLGLHKSVVNRILEPYMWHTVIATATAWENFFDQRVSPLAQPEMNAVATLLQKAMVESTPTVMCDGMWHTPYVDDDEKVWLTENGFDVRHISAARCARTSYLTQDGKRDPSEDERLYQRLVTEKPPHSSPLAHVCTPDSRNIVETWIEDTDYTYMYTEYKFVTPAVGQLLGWKQWRHIVEGRNGEVSFR